MEQAPSFRIESAGMAINAEYDLKTLEFVLTVNRLKAEVGDEITVWVTMAGQEETRVDGTLTGKESHGTSYRKFEFTAEQAFPEFLFANE